MEQYPKSANDAIFKDKLAGLEKIIGADAVKLFAEVRENAKPLLKHVEVIRELSNSTKHWELIPTTASAAAIAFNVIGGAQEIVGIPNGHFLDQDEFVYWKSVYPPPSPSISILIKLRLVGLEAENAGDPISHFGLASEYVRRVISAAENLLGWTGI